jgi:hypothetical protein
MSNSSGDEVDLKDIAVKVIRYFLSHFNFIVICILLGTGFGTIFYELAPTRFESKMVVMSDILRESYSDLITEDLSLLIKEKNDSVLAAKLNITREEARDIKSIELEGVSKDIASMNGEETIFIISVEVGNKKVLMKLQDGLINFLRNNEFVKTRVKQREQKYNILIDKIGNEIKSLDSLKRRLFNHKPVYSSSSEMMLVDPTNIYSTIIDLTKQQIDLKNALELFNSIQLIEGFTAFKKPKSPNLSVSLFTGFSLGLLAAVGILTLKGLVRMARENTQKQQ